MKQGTIGGCEELCMFVASINQMLFQVCFPTGLTTLGETRDFYDSEVGMGWVPEYQSFHTSVF